LDALAQEGRGSRGVKQFLPFVETADFVGGFALRKRKSQNLRKIKIFTCISQMNVV
jgi:hypothetical protein